MIKTDEATDKRLGLKMRLRHPVLASSDTQKTVLMTNTACEDMREAARVIDALEADLTTVQDQRAEAIKNDVTLQIRLGRARQSVKELLTSKGWSNLSDKELAREEMLGNGYAPIIRRARAVLDPNIEAEPPAEPSPNIVAALERAIEALRPFAKAYDYFNLRPPENVVKITVKVGNIIAARAVVEQGLDLIVPAKQDEPSQPRCETCRFWDNSTTLFDNEDTGRCRAVLPRATRDGKAVWPHPESHDWCGLHEPEPNE